VNRGEKKFCVGVAAPVKHPVDYSSRLEISAHRHYRNSRCCWIGDEHAADGSEMLFLVRMPPPVWVLLVVKPDHCFVDDDLGDEQENGWHGRFLKGGQVLGDVEG